MPKQFTTNFTASLVLMKNSEVSVIFCVLVQPPRTRRAQDHTDRERVKTSDGDIGSRRLMEERMTSMQLSPLSSQKTATERAKAPHNISKDPSFEVLFTQSIHYVSI